MTPAQKTQTARLFAALEYGERLAHDCARRQASLLDDRRAQRFLQTQARQESAHALLFRGAADWLAPKQWFTTPPALRDFGDSLQRALSRNDLTESLVASQIVLEGLGEQILTRLNHGMDNHGIGFSRQRKLLLRQEQGHYAFGLRTLEQRLQTEYTRIEHVHELADGYIRLIQRISAEMADVFAALDENAADYTDGLIAGLPAWLDPSRRTALSANSDSV